MTSRRRTAPLALALSLVALLAVGCTSTEEPGAQVTATTRPSGPPPLEADGGRQKLAGFGEVTVTFVAADGTRTTTCLLLAEVAKLRDQGLMFVEDPELGGYDGMLFVFETEDQGSFWMKNTRLPLSIAWFRADGSLVGTDDMQPCPDSVETCPVYPSGEAYRYAVEVPLGRLGEVGVAEGTLIEVGGKDCVPV